MRVVCISDTHTLHERLVVPDGDLLIHAGDFTSRGSREDTARFDAWLGALPHQHKVVIAGNHDLCFERDAAAPSWIRHAVYLCDAAHVVNGWRIWGSPWQPRFFDWAFNLDRGAPLRKKWDRIPLDTDILVTHGPPADVLDLAPQGGHVGCADLLTAVQRVRPCLHVFGHIHEGYGTYEHDGTLFVNASSCDGRYHPIQPPIVIDIERGQAPRILEKRT